MRTVGDGTRILNFLIDTLIIFALAYAAYRGWTWYVVYWRYPHYNFDWFFFGVLFIYYLFFEGLFGRTPGKWFSYSKVVGMDGSRPGFGWIFIRSFSRLILIDMFFIPVLGKPLHDYLSKTRVVEA